MTTQNGIGASVLRAIKGSVLEVRWTPELVVTIDNESVPGVDSVEVTPSYGAVPSQILFSFRLKSAPRSAVVTRAATSFAATANNDGFTAALTAL